jgi:hypothetical protein
MELWIILAAALPVTALCHPKVVGHLMELWIILVAELLIAHR